MPGADAAPAERGLDQPQSGGETRRARMALRIELQVMRVAVGGEKTCARRGALGDVYAERRPVKRFAAGEVGDAQVQVAPADVGRRGPGGG